MKAWLRGGAITVALLVLVLPVGWMVASAFKTNVQITDPGSWLVFTPTLENFGTVLSGGELPSSMLNSLIVGVTSTALSAVLAVPAAWAVGRFRLHGTGSLVLVARIVPAISLLVPWYYLFAQLGLVGSYAVLVLSHMFVSVPLILWVMISFFEGLPVELEEAAQIDGLTPFGTFLRIALPLAMPGIATACVLAFISSWNNFMFALILADEDTKTLPVTLFSFVSYAGTDWGGLMAAATITTLPALAVALLAQKHIVAGLTAGATKG
ncbi:MULTISPECIES: carbohydrate ABC transporter permease [unclassified Crossiella]|uniref:carbohydrate ABC transporter permease n=1 Tax=unclassified Crossiella TaxID=2620835 RepID=UPI001FFF6C78|nr:MULTISPECIES: carbohydrate ABC transporter permease [unclassified Crossiella]MCK2244472.1 carbohydrate ABC transporter permease [Crossiella sp. S99.2]MCK2258103.1 carbohydrate ABC transporter permease [Crossiella sp. S99.1]